MLNRKYKEIEEVERSRGNSENYKGKKGDRDGKNKGECKNKGLNIRYAEIAIDSPKNTAISTDLTELVSGENRAGFPDREVLSLNIKTRFMPN